MRCSSSESDFRDRVADVWHHTLPKLKINWDSIRTSKMKQ